MIKEIEVGSVKHSITIADDMVGQGLKKEENGAVKIDAEKVVDASAGLETKDNVIKLKINKQSFEFNSDGTVTLKFNSSLALTQNGLGVNAGYGLKIESGGLEIDPSVLVGGNSVIKVENVFSFEDLNGRFNAGTRIFGLYDGRWEFRAEVLDNKDICGIFSMGSFGSARFIYNTDTQLLSLSEVIVDYSSDLIDIKDTIPFTYCCGYFRHVGGMDDVRFQVLDNGGSIVILSATSNHIGLYKKGFYESDDAFVKIE